MSSDSNSLPPYNLPFPSGSPIDQIGQFEEILKAGKDKGIISVTPESREETYQVESQKIRLQTVASRLWLLGYLPKKIAPHKIDSKLDAIKLAVGRFQKDADLKKDLWVGDKTWYALDELVSFESELSGNQWFENGQIKPSAEKAVHRAAQLRLWSLGLFPTKPQSVFKKLTRKDLKNFDRILRIMLVKRGTFNVKLDEKYIRLLFNQDLLTDSIAKRASPTHRSFLLNLYDETKVVDQELAQSFIVNCAKIELWLLGYDVDIDGTNNFQSIQNSKLSKAITHFYEHFENKSRSKARALARSITPDLFAYIARANRIPEGEDVDDASDLVAQQMESSDQIKNAWSYLKDKGMRLWDGLKRIWRWIKKIGRKVVSFIKENVFKAFFRYASKAFKIINKGIDAVVDSIGVYIKGHLISKDISFEFSIDSDTTTFFTRGITEEDIDSGLKMLRRQTMGFSVASRIIGWVFDIFKRIATGFIGWARLLYSLVKGYKELHKLYQDFKLLAT